MRIPKHFRVGTVIRFKAEAIEEEDYFQTENTYLLKHTAWIIMRSRPDPERDDIQVRLRPANGGIAMTKWLNFFDEEVTVDPFLTAVHKATKKSAGK